MAVKRQKNWLGQQRVDVPHLREIESAIVNDFDDLAGKILASGQPLIVFGMTIAMGAAVGGFANQLVLNTASAILLHATASEAGTLFVVPSNQPAETLNSSNANVIGSFTPNATNYIGIDLVRVADSTTDDTVKFRSATTLKEFSQQVPLARTLQYRVVISTNDFSLQPSVAPVAKVAVDANSLVTSVTDCREMMFRLGTGGTSPNPTAVFAWPGGRTELPSTSTSTADPFTGADKSIYSFTDFFRALESRLWEVGGGEHWYSATSDRDLQLVRDPAQVFVATSDNFEWTGTNIHWKGLSFIFGNSTASYNYIANQTADSPGLTDLAVGDALYVDLDRAANHGTALNTPNPGDLIPLVMHKAVLQNLGTPTIPGSRQLIAWRTAQGVFTRGSTLTVGASVGHASTVVYGAVELYSNTGTDAIVPAVDINGVISANGLRRTSAGALLIGDGANDTQVIIGQSAGTTYLDAGSVICNWDFTVMGATMLNGAQSNPPPLDDNTSKVPTTSWYMTQASSATPLLAAGAGAVGTSKRWARGDHVHPADPALAPLASPTFTGTPAAPTAPQDTNTTQLATTAFVVAQASTSTPLIDGGAAIGTSLRYARADHVHPAATPYTLPPATTVTLGGVMVPVGANLSLDGSGNLTLTNANVIAAIGYTPVSRSGSGNVEDHAIEIGWTGGSITPNNRLRATIDAGGGSPATTFLGVSDSGTYCVLDSAIDITASLDGTKLATGVTLSADFKVYKAVNGFIHMQGAFHLDDTFGGGYILTAANFLPAGALPAGSRYFMTFIARPSNSVYYISVTVNADGAVSGGASNGLGGIPAPTAGNTSDIYVNCVIYKV